MRRVAGLLLLGMTLAGCAGAPLPGAEEAAAAAAAAPLARSTWVLTELNGRPPLPLPAGGALSLRFDDVEPRVSGNGGCNTFNGPYVRQGESLRMGPLASTRRACADEAANAQETAYLQALQSTTRASAAGGMLALYAGDRLVARFRPAGA